MRPDLTIAYFTSLAVGPTIFQDFFQSRMYLTLGHEACLNICCPKITLGHEARLNICCPKNKSPTKRAFSSQSRPAIFQTWALSISNFQRSDLKPRFKDDQRIPQVIRSWGLCFFTMCFFQRRRCLKLGNLVRLNICHSKNKSHGKCSFCSLPRPTIFQHGSVQFLVSEEMA